MPAIPIPMPVTAVFEDCLVDVLKKENLLLLLPLSLPLLWLGFVMLPSLLMLLIFKFE